MSRFSIAMLAYVALAILAVTTLTETVALGGRQVPLSVITLAVLGMFAFRTWLHHKRELLEASDEHEPDQVEPFSGCERSGSPLAKP